MHRLKKPSKIQRIRIYYGVYAKGRSPTENVLNVTIRILT